MEHKELLRFREKSHFVEANDPASLLAEFFIAASQRPAVRKTLASEAPRQLPLLLISQLPRSGGSLFSQLLDGHPASVCATSAASRLQVWNDLFCLA